MFRSIGTIVVSGLLTISSGLSAGEEGRKLPKIGELFGSNPSASKPYDQALRNGLRDLGYAEGKNVMILARYANGDNTRFPALLAELVALDVDVLVVTPTAAHAAKRATSRIPIILPSFGDPVKAGLVASLARPGGNITGQSAAAPETDEKLLELTMETLPGLKRLGVLFESEPGIASAYAEESAYGEIARRHGVTLRQYEVKSLENIQSAIKRIAQDRIQAVFVVSTYLTVLHREPIVAGLAAERVPVVSAGRDMAEAGALLTYSPDYFDLWKRSATYVDKILKGAKPGDLPIEQPTKFELIVNSRVADTFRVTIPESVLVRADHVLR